MTLHALEMYRSLREDLGEAGLAQLRQEVKAHLAKLALAQAKHELIALDLAELLASRLLALLDEAPRMDAESRAAVVGAARYFCSTEDLLPDEASCMGLDDDVEVFNHVVESLERRDLIIVDN